MELDKGLQRARGTRLFKLSLQPHRGLHQRQDVPLLTPQRITRYVPPRVIDEAGAQQAHERGAVVHVARTTQPDAAYLRLGVGMDGTHQTVLAHALVAARTRREARHILRQTHAAFGRHGQQRSQAACEHYCAT